jgi:adenylyltransferase/sulfurtransferase
VTALDKRLDGKELEREARGAQVVLDCSDNFPTRYALNAACVRARVPLVWGAAIRMQGQITTFDHRRTDSPCLACFYPDQPEADGGGCAASGVLAPAAGIVGCMMAAEALKLVVGFGDTLCGRVLLLDIAAMQPRHVRLTRDPACPVCGPQAGTCGSSAVSGNRL